MNIQKLQAQIRAVNSAHAYAMRLYPILADYFRPMVGCKIMKADNQTLLAKIVNGLPDFPDNPPFRVYEFSSEYSLRWVVQECITVNGVSHYHDADLYIAFTRYGAIDKMCDAPQFKCDYQIETLEHIGNSYQEAKKLADDFFSQLGPFQNFWR
jgi:hypothetical protein